MAVRDDFTAGEVLAAADLNDTFASKLDLAGGKILQIVRATDTIGRTTTSTSYVDAGISVTITPQRTDSAIVLIWSANVGAVRSAAKADASFRITDNSDNALQGAQRQYLQVSAIGSGATQTSGIASLLVIGYNTPATTAPTTYKGRYKAELATTTVSVRNSFNTGQLYAIEVSA